MLEKRNPSWRSGPLALTVTALSMTQVLGSTAGIAVHCESWGIVSLGVRLFRHGWDRA